MIRIKGEYPPLNYFHINQQENDGRCLTALIVLQLNPINKKIYNGKRLAAVLHGRGYRHA
jgi:hypothetical protein